MIADQGFELHPGAASDITSIWEFIAEDNPNAAGRVREDILDAIRGLVAFPNQGHARMDLTSQPLRFRTVRNYLIAYAPHEKPLLIVGVIHGPSQPSCHRGHPQEQKIIHSDRPQSLCTTSQTPPYSPHKAS